MTNSKRLPLTEELDFHYLLSLLPPLSGDPNYSWLPELFSIIGYEKLIELSKYAGGELVRIPTMEQLATAMKALQWFYDVYLINKKSIDEIPLDIRGEVNRILEIYNARDDQERDSEATKQ